MVELNLGEWVEFLCLGGRWSLKYRGCSMQKNVLGTGLDELSLSRGDSPSWNK